MIDFTSRNVLVVGEQIHRKRIDSFLAQELKSISRSQIQKLITDDQVFLNGKIAVKRDNVCRNDIVEISFRGFRHERELPVAQEMPLEILYEDEHLIAINKKCGVVVHPGSGIRDGTLVNALMHHCRSLSNRNTIERPGVVHRLDKDTTGVIIAAKNNAAHDALTSAFMNRTVQKVYIGFCVGKVTKDHDIIDLSLDRSKRDPIKRAPSIHGKPSKTEYFVLNQRCGILAMSFILHTGRTHQIRVHCNAMGFPIVADTLYGGGKERISRIDPLDRPFANTIFKCFSRQALHAYSISFKHPVSGEQLSITALPPEDFQKAMVLFGDSKLFNRNKGM